MSDKHHSTRYFPAHRRIGPLPLERAAQSLIERGVVSSAEIAQIDIAALAATWREGRLPLPAIDRLVDRKGRVMAAVRGVEGRVVARYLGERARALVERHRPPATGLLISSARGVGRAVRELANAARDIHDGTIVLFDVRQCFPSIAPHQPIRQLDEWAGAPSAAGAAMLPLYLAANEAGIPGLAQGLSPSSALADVALDPLDRAFARYGRVGRYVDNYALAMAAGTVLSREAIQRIAAGHGYELHEWASVEVRDGLVVGAAEWLGVRISSLNFQPHFDLTDDRWAEINSIYHERSAVDPASGNAYLLGIERQLTPLLTGGSERLRYATRRIRTNRSPLESSVQSTDALDAASERHLTTRFARKGMMPIVPTEATHPVASVGGPVAERYVRPSYSMPFDTYHLGQACFARVRQIAGREITDAQAVGLVFVDFMATNDFRGRKDPEQLLRYLFRLAVGLGLPLMAFDPETCAPLVFVDPQANKAYALDGGAALAPDSEPPVGLNHSSSPMPHEMQQGADSAPGDSRDADT